MPLPTNWVTGNQFGASDMNLLEAAVNATTPDSTSQALSGTTLTMTIASTPIQIFTGTTQNQVVTLPSTAGADNQQWLLINQGTTATVTCNASGSGTPIVIAPGAAAILTATSTTPTTAANWLVQYGGVVVTSGKVVSFVNTLTFSGTDGTTMTFPATSATIARTDAAQAFTGVQTMASPAISGTVSGGATYTSPVLTTPVLGTPASGSLGSCTGLPANGGLTGQVPIANGGTNATTAATGLANLAAGGVPNTLIPNGIQNANFATQSQLTVAATKYYMTNSALKLPASALAGMVAGSSSLVTGTTFRWRFTLAKSAAGTGTFFVYIFRGTAGSSADTADVSTSIATGTATALADTFVMTVQAVVTTTGATGAYFWSMVIEQRTGTSTTGFGIVAPPLVFTGTVSSVAMNTSGLIFGLGFSNTTGTPTVTVPQMQANCFNMD